MAYALKDWAAFLEVFGMPLRIGRYGQNATDKEIAILRNAVINLGSDAAAIMHESMQIEFQDAVQGRGGESLFLAAAEFWDKQTSKVVLGQTASTEGTPGKLGADNAQMEVREDLLRADAAALAATLNRDLTRPFIDLNFGVPPDGQYPRISLLVPEPDNTAMQIDAVARLVPLGLKVDARAVREILGLPEPEEGAELLGGKTPERKEGSKTTMQQALLAMLANVQKPAADDLDALTDEALADWDPLMQPLLDPLIEAVEQASSQSDLEKRLAVALPHSDTSTLAKALASATFKARALADDEG